MNLVSLQTQAKSVSWQLVEAMLEMAGACWGGSQYRDSCGGGVGVRRGCV